MACGRPWSSDVALGTPSAGPEAFFYFYFFSFLAFPFFKIVFVPVGATQSG